MLVIKNTAALDFAVPLMYKIKQENPQANVSVLYCTLSRKKILRESSFYSDVLSRYGISQYDFADFLQTPYVALRGLWRRLCSRSNWDSSPWDRRLRQFPGGKRVSHYMQHSLNRLENSLTHKVNVQQILPSLNPDVVLIDNTTVTKFYGREFFYTHFSSANKKVVLLPHAPHHSTTTAFTPFDEEGEELPDYCDFWMPFKFDKTWENLPEKESQFAYVGYPGLDTEWLEQFKAHDRIRTTEKTRLSRSQEPLRCLFIIRRFLAKGQIRGAGHNAFIQDYDEFSYYLDLVGTAIKNAEVEIELIVKPHPSNDFQALKEVFAESEIPNWRITHDPIYAIISEIDFVISLYSTTLLIPAIVGIPVVLLNSSTQSVVHQEDEFKQLYTGLHFYLEDPEDLPLRLKEVIEIASGRKKTGLEWNGDVKHLRYFYPDGAIQRCINRLGAI
jgi:hypothetical protein